MIHTQRMTRSFSSPENIDDGELFLCGIDVTEIFWIDIACVELVSRDWLCTYAEGDMVVFLSMCELVAAAGPSVGELSSSSSEDVGRTVWLTDWAWPAEGTTVLIPLGEIVGKINEEI